MTKSKRILMVLIVLLVCGLSVYANNNFESDCFDFYSNVESFLQNFSDISNPLEIIKMISGSGSIEVTEDVDLFGVAKVLSGSSIYFSVIDGIFIDANIQGRLSGTKVAAIFKMSGSMLSFKATIGQTNYNLMNSIQFFTDLKYMFEKHFDEFSERLSGQIDVKNFSISLSSGEESLEFKNDGISYAQITSNHICLDMTSDLSLSYQNKDYKAFFSGNNLILNINSPIDYIYSIQPEDVLNTKEMKLFFSVKSDGQYRFYNNADILKYLQ